MANPQPDEFTRISNELLENFAKIKIPSNAMQILLVIIRKTYGFQKKKDKISLTLFSNLTNIKISNCSRSIKMLENMNMILVKREQYISEYSIQKDYEKWGLNKQDTITTESISTDKDTITTDTLSTESNTITTESETTITTESDKRKKETNKRKVQESIENSLTVQNIWIRSFGRNPKPLETDTTEKIIKKFGAEKTLNIFQSAVRKNFHSVFTLEKSLDQNGNIKAKGNSNYATSKASVKSRTDYRYDEAKAKQRLKELEEMDPK